MGMSASQARMLSLTARLSDLEYAAQNISNSKIALSTRSQEASNKYLAALDKQKLTVKNPDNNTYINATAHNLTTYNAISKIDKQRFLKNSAGQVLISQEVATAYQKAKAAAGNDPAGSQDWIDNYNGKSNWITNAGASTAGAIANGDFTLTELKAYNEGIKSGEEQFLQQFSDATSGTGFTNCLTMATGYKKTDNNTQQDKVGLSYYKAEFAEIEECGYQVIPSGKENDSEWLYEQLNNGNIFLSEKNSTGDFVDVSWSSGDASLVTDGDDIELARAEAEYEATNTEIATKDKRFDQQLKSIDTEHTAVQTEIESVKKVIDKNIDRSFKIFDA